MKEMNHACVAKFYDSFDDDDNYYLILELYEKIVILKIFRV